MPTSTRVAPDSPPTLGAKAVFLVSILTAVVSISFRQIAASDVWWHAALGKWMIHKVSLPDPSTMYFTPVVSGVIGSELRWTWLGDITLYAVYFLGGAAGLQILVLAILSLALWILWQHAPQKFFPWVGILLIMVALATYQLQLARSSLFSLAFYPAVLSLALGIRSKPGLKDLLPVSAVLIGWSFFHGSCLLGWVTTAVLVIVKILAVSDTLFERAKRCAVAGMLLAAVLGVLCFGRAGAYDFFFSPFRHFLSPAGPASFNPQQTPVPNGPSQPEKTRELSNDQPFQLAKQWLNQSIWKSGGATPASNDFKSPFDFPASLPMLSAAVLGGFALVAVISGRIGPGLVLAWVGIVFLALGYVRMVGYAGIASCFLIFEAARGLSLPEKPRKFINIFGWVLLPIMAGFFLITMLTNRMDRLTGEGQHVSSWGATPTFDEKTLQWVQKRFPKNNVFTSIDSGSAALLIWDFKKPVFLAGFFAVHHRKLFVDYRELLETRDLQPLEDKYRCSVAVIPNGAAELMDVFLSSKDWVPAGVGMGYTVFVLEAQMDRNLPPEILFSQKDIENTSAFFARNASLALFAVLGHAKETGRGYSVRQWVLTAPELIQSLPHILQSMQ